MTEIADRESFALGVVTAWLLIMATFLLGQTAAWFIINPTAAEFTAFYSRPLISLREVAIALLALGVVTLGVVVKSRPDGGNHTAGVIDDAE